MGSGHEPRQTGIDESELNPEDRRVVVVPMRE